MQADNADDINVENFTETKSHRAARPMGVNARRRSPRHALGLSTLGGGLLIAAVIVWKLAAKRKRPSVFNSAVD